MKNIQDIRQRDIMVDGPGGNYYNTQENINESLLSGGTIRIVPPPSVTTQTRNRGDWGIGVLLFVIICFVGELLLIGFSAKTGYDQGYKQAKIDYHIKP
jgi:hypothetical protein